MVKWYTDWKVRVGWSLGKYRGRSTAREQRDKTSRKRGEEKDRKVHQTGFKQITNKPE